MTTEEMLDSLWAVFAQIRADQKKEEYDDILVMVSEIAYFLQNEFWSMAMSIFTSMCRATA